MSWRASLGIERIRSEMMLHWTSSVPPAIEIAEVETKVSATTPPAPILSNTHGEEGEAGERGHG